jgi:hypothetical protein
VQEFNKGVYDYIIATDEGTGRGDIDSDDEMENKETPADGDECVSLRFTSSFTQLTLMYRPSDSKRGG